MSHELINLTLPTVIQELENALNEYPVHPYQSAFSIHELRQKLIAHILSQIPNRYIVEGTQESSKKLTGLCPVAVKERIYRETVIHGSILHILRENADLLSNRFSLKSRIQN